MKRAEVNILFSACSSFFCIFFSFFSFYIFFFNWITLAATNGVSSMKYEPHEQFAPSANVPRVNVYRQTLKFPPRTRKHAGKTPVSQYTYICIFFSSARQLPKIMLEIEWRQYFFYSIFVDFFFFFEIIEFLRKLINFVLLFIFRFENIFFMINISIFEFSFIFYF